MLYLLYQGNHDDLDYRGGQEPIIHLEADLNDVIQYCNENSVRWAFTLGNAGSYYFEDRCDIAQLEELNWEAINARNWKECREDKAAELLIEKFFPWKLVRKIGVLSESVYHKVTLILGKARHKPELEIMRDWYY